MTADLRRVAEHHGLLRQLTDAFGSPLSIVCPQALNQNFHDCQAVLDQSGVQSRVFFAHKANRSSALIRQAASITGLNLDVASEGELISGLSSGFSADRIEATGPKNRRFLKLILQHGIICNVDNLQELQTVTELHRALGLRRPARIVLRSEAVRRSGRTPDTKFGLSERQMAAAIDWIGAHSNELLLLGFAFHLSSTNGNERARAMESLIPFHLRALGAGLSPSVFNVGGGFKTNHLDGAEQWSDYGTALKRSLVEGNGDLSWNGTAFNMDVTDGNISGSAHLPTYFRADTMVPELEAFLPYRLQSQGGRSVADFLTDNEIELHLEPGRALVDQAGLTVSRVNFTKTTSSDAVLVGLDMNRSNLGSSDREMFVDPLLLPLRTEGDEAVGVYFGGNLCLPDDMIMRHKVFLDRLPTPGDLVVFPNTAGYFMDFIESETLLQRTAEKVAVIHTDAGLRWTTDKDYDPLLGAVS